METPNAAPAGTPEGGTESTPNPLTVADLAAGTPAQMNDGAPAQAEGKPETAPTEAQKAAARKYKLQIDGQEIEEELTEDQLLKGYQKAKAADKRFQEAATIKQQVARLHQLLKEDGLSVLEKLHGPEKTRQMLEERLWKHIQREQMDPKERELLDTKDQLARYREMEQKQQRAAQEAQQKQLIEQHKVSIEKEISEEFQKAGMTKTPYAFQRAAFYLAQALQQGQRIPVSQIIPQIQQDLQNDLKKMFETADEDGILTLLGDQVMEKVRKADLKRLKNPPVAKTPTPPAPVQDGKKKDANELVKRTSLFDW